MAMVEALLTQHIDLWTSAIRRKSSAGRGSSKKVELYGIKKLRELILELAVRGLLVPQDPSDEPASELLKKIAAEKAKLAKEGKIKKEKPLPPIDVASKDFKAPVGWSWCRITDLAFSQAGFAFKSNGFNESGEGLPLIRIRDVGQPFSGTFFSGDYRNEFVVIEGDYLISMDGNFRVAEWRGKEALLNQRVSRLIFYDEDIAKRFVAEALQIRLMELQGLKAYTTVDHLSGGQISSSVIALPPLAEQHRIVAKVDELMALCDQLEQQTEDSLAAHQALVETLLSALTTASLQNGGREIAWQRIADHFDTLFTTEQSIDTLKQTILQLAVMGKLVPQNPKDEPASELLKKIAAEKARLVKEGKVKKEKPLPAITEEDIHICIPPGWQVIRLGEIAQVIRGVSYQKQDAHDATFEGSIPLLRANNINVELNFQDLLHLPSAIVRPEQIVNRGDILIAMSSGSADLVGKAAQAREDLKSTFGAFCAVLRPLSESLFAFLGFFCATPFYRSQTQATGKGIGIQNLNKSGLELITVVIPPLNEQHRIVAKVDELMALCDQLKARLSDAQATQLNLADALTDGAILRV